MSPTFLQPLEDSSRTRLVAKLRTALDGFVAQLKSLPESSAAQTSSDKENSNEQAAVELHNFVHSAKSQISKLLSKEKKVSKENSAPKPFHVDPLQIQISLKLQGLLCDALDSKRCNATPPSGGHFDGNDLEDLSHLLQDFLGSAKRKLSSSLNDTSVDTSHIQSVDTPTTHSETDSIGGPTTTSVTEEVSEISGTDNKQSGQKLSDKKATKTESDETNGRLNSRNKRSSNGRIPSEIDLLIEKAEARGVTVQSISEQLKKKLARPSIKAETNEVQILNNKKPEVTVTSISEQLKQKLNKSGQTIVQKKQNKPKESDSNKSSQTKELEAPKRPQTAKMNPDFLDRGGILFLNECQRTPDFLDLNLDVDQPESDDPVYDSADFIRSGYKDSDSDEEVVVLGEKKKTYQEITLDDDDDDEEDPEPQERPPVRIPRDFQDLLYPCPSCDKKFRVESLLKFHVRMHSVVESRSGREQVEQAKVPRKEAPQSRHSQKENENKSKSSRSPHKSKSHAEKHAKRKAKTSH